jgi:hypothetical protein
VQECVGDCNHNGNVSTPELLLGIGIALDDLAIEACSPADAGSDGAVTIDELVRAVDEHLDVCNFMTPTATPTPLPPDLVPDSVTLIAPTPAIGCIGSLDELHTSLNVCVRNDGGGASPAFQADLSGRVLDFGPLPAGQTQCLSVAGGGLPGGLTLSVDPQNAVAESNESNNQRTYSIPVLTPPLTCTPTPTHTPLPPGTPSETPAPTDTTTPSRTATEVFTATASPKATATSTPTQTPTATSTPRLPDLVPNRIVVVAPTPVGGCVHNINEVVVSMQVCVLNDSNGAAGPFQATLTVAGSINFDFDGAPADAEVCRESELVGGQVIFAVDTGHAVTESNEANNSAVFFVPRPTAPPICSTPTPTPG